MLSLIFSPGYELDADETPARLGLRKPMAAALSALVYDEYAPLMNENAPLINKFFAYCCIALDEFDENINSFLYTHPSHLVRDLHMRFVETFFSSIILAEDAEIISERVRSNPSSATERDFLFYKGRFLL